ncbi:YbdK family carboxylate-amine ligase [Streptomyces sp. AJS327]|uniref:carboxylate-amine ligase n=1 Tax=Streptomyces sp. AJS327 TaxID=2545265 RepID=UPI00180023B7|nr:glutamate--cysteine ligase [Streptomyces sp. AJS327]MBA0052375.1 YbdK family carboxylate-amine ligase [Streptomyces sp. AJS327]
MTHEEIEPRPAPVPAAPARPPRVASAVSPDAPSTPRGPSGLDAPGAASAPSAAPAPNAPPAPHGGPAWDAARPRPAGAARSDAAGRGGTLGVEEEFLLVDADSGEPVPRAEDVLAGVKRDGIPAAAAVPGAEDGQNPRLKREFLACQVESVSEVCSGLDELASQLLASRRQLSMAAEAAGLRLLSTGLPVGGDSPWRISRGGKYERFAAEYQAVAWDFAASGCHVHVSVPDRDTAVAVVNHLRPWLPTLLALSVNSPFDRGADTGYGSWRLVEHSRLPSSGLPPHFASAADHDAAVDRLVECGAVVDPTMCFWMARPSPRFPTVELRVADAAATVEDALLQAGLARGLVRTALADLAAGREAAPTEYEIGACAVWNAARYGLRGPGVRLADARRVPAVTLVGELLEHTVEALEETGDLTRVRRLLDGVRAHGTGADRQRAAARWRPDGTADLSPLPAFLARQTLQAPGAGPRATGPSGAAPGAEPS